MSARGVGGEPPRGIPSALRLLARPVRAASGRGGVVVQPYRGYGSREEVFLIGRVFRQPPAPGDRARGRPAATRSTSGDGSCGGVSAGSSWPPASAGRNCGSRPTGTATSGFACTRSARHRPTACGTRWTLSCSVPSGEGRRRAVRAPRHLPPRGDQRHRRHGHAHRRGQQAEMLWRLFVQGAESRVAFPGMAALLRALHAGPAGAEHNPTLYVSRAPWGNYEVLDAFFRLHGIPVGPLLFLREWGLTVQSPLPRRDKDHKLELIRSMLASTTTCRSCSSATAASATPRSMRAWSRSTPGGCRRSTSGTSAGIPSGCGPSRRWRRGWRTRAAASCSPRTASPWPSTPPPAA